MATSTESEVDTQLRDARDGVQSLVARADTKAQALLSTHSLALAGAVALAKMQLGGAAAVGLVVAAGLFGVALVTTLLVILPRLNRTKTGLTAWARQNPDEIRECAADEYAGTDVAAHLGTLSRIALGKFRLIRLSIALVVTGLVTTGLSFAI